MDSIIKAMAPVLLIAIGGLALFVYAVWRRWFSRLHSGFLVTLIVALVGTGVTAACLVGTWGYEAARRIVFQGVVVDLQNVGDIVERQIQDDIDVAFAQLARLAEQLAPDTVRNISVQERQQRLLDIVRFNPFFLQLNVLDADGKLIVSTTAGKTTEPVNRLAVAYSLEGRPFASEPYVSQVFQKTVLHLSVPINPSQVVGVVSARVDLQDDLLELVKTTRFNRSGYAALVNSDGRIMAHPDPKRINDDVSQYPAVQQGLQGRNGWVIARNKAGLERLMFYRPVKSPATINPKPWVLLTEMDQGEALAVLRALRIQFALGILVLAVGCFVVAYVLSTYIKRPLHELVDFSKRIQKGDLTAQAAVGGRDAMGQLADSLNAMVRGLQERDRVKELFGRYVATQVSDEVLKGQVNLGGAKKRTTILFSDIRDFTSMSEQMTPEQVVSFLNNYFSEMVEAVFENGGVLDKFIGDGMMAVFGSMGQMPDHPRKAVLTALRMKALLAKINGERGMAGKQPIAIGIGIHTDDVIVGNIGSRKRLEFTVVGDGVNTSSRVQSLNKEFGTTILITETTHEAVKDEFECRPMPEVRLRGKTKELALFEVLSVKAVAAVV